jgi:hypothetical protein
VNGFGLSLICIWNEEFVVDSQFDARVATAVPRGRRDSTVAHWPSASVGKVIVAVISKKGSLARCNWRTMEGSQVLRRAEQLR